MFTAQATSLTGATTAAAWLAEERTEAAVRLGWSENIHARLGQDYKRLAPLHRRPASEFVGSSDGSDWGRYLPTRTWPRKRSSQPGARGGHGAAVTSVQASCGSRWNKSRKRCEHLDLAFHWTVVPLDYKPISEIEEIKNTPGHVRAVPPGHARVQEQQARQRRRHCPCQDPLPRLPGPNPGLQHLPAKGKGQAARRSALSTWLR